MTTAAQFYKDNMGLIHIVSKKGYARLQSAGVGLDYEDVFQELSVVFVKAYEKFDSTKGFAFSTYFFRAAFNKLNSWAQAMIDERLNQGVVSVQELNQGEDDEEREDIHLTDYATPESYCRVNEFLEHVGNTLSPLAALILAWVVTPPQELLEELRKADEHARYARARGYNAKCMVDITPRYVAGFIRMLANVSQRETEHALKEIDRLRRSDARLFLGA